MITIDLLKLSPLFFVLGVIGAQRESRVLNAEGAPTSWLSSDGTLRFHEGLEEQVIPTGIAVSGGAWGYIDSVYEHALVCGMDSSGRGLLEHYRRAVAGGVFTLQSAIVHAQRDYVGIRFDGSVDKLYALDYASRSIYRVAWDGVSSLPSTGWALYANMADVPDLINAEHRTLAAASGGVALRPYERFSVFAEVRISGEPDNLLVSHYSPLAPPKVAVIETSVSTNGLEIRVRGVEGTSFEVVQVSAGTVVASGAIPTGLVEHRVFPTSGLSLGERYGTREPSDIVRSEFTCMRRYGHPETMGDGTQIERMVHPERLAIGKTAIVDLPLTRQPLSSDPGPYYYSGLLGVAAGDPSPGGASDPVIPIGGNYVIDTNVFLPVQGTIWAAGSEGHLQGAIGIPNDGSLIDSVVLLQFIVTESTGACEGLSEIIGAKIGGTMGAALSIGSAGVSVLSAKGLVENPFLIPMLLKRRAQK